MANQVQSVEHASPHLRRFGSHPVQTEVSQSGHTEEL